MTTDGRLIRDNEGRVFRIPYGKRDVPSFSVDWVGTDGGWRMFVFPGLERRPDAAIERAERRVAQA